MQVTTTNYALQIISSPECCGHIIHYLGNLNTIINNFYIMLDGNLMDMYGHLRGLRENWYIELDLISK
jgi:hypothetical protein